MSFKESWQNFLTKVDDRIPIKKITAPLDKKFALTSFFLFLLIFLIILYFIFGNSFIGKKADLTSITIRFADNEDNILSNFDFKIRNLSDGTTNTYTTNNNGSFTISLDKKKLYTVIVEKEGYDFFETEIVFDRNTFNFILTVLKVPSSFKKTIYFEDTLTNQKITDELLVSIVCDNREVVTSSLTKTSTGSLAIEIPSSCNLMYADVSSDKYNEKNLLVKLSDSIIKLTPRGPVTDVGSINVLVVSGEEYIYDSITLRLFSKDDPVTSIRTIQTNNSQGSFSSIPVGEYIVKATDVMNNYLASEKEVEVFKNYLSELTIDMQNTSNPLIDPDTNQAIELREITVFVKDKDTGEVLEDSLYPVVTLLLDGTENIDEREKQDGFIFKIDKNKNYSLKAVAEGYLGQIIPITSSLEVYNINLEKITPSNVSNIYVSIFDEDLKPVIGIKSWIYDGDADFINPLFSYAVSDENGVAVFENIPEIDFTIKTKNLYIEEISSKYRNLPPEDTNVSLPVVIGKGTVNLSIKNKTDDVVSNSLVTFYSESGELLGTDIATNIGRISKDIKADKRVYVLIETDGYLPYFTDVFRIYKNKTVTKEIVLERASQAQDTVVEYLGLYNALEQKVESLKNNEVFYLRFKVIMPPSSTGFNFALRAGSYEDVKEDIVFIMPENSTLGTSIYYEKEPFTESGNFLESKLVNIQVNNFPASTHEIYIPIRIKNAKTNDLVSFFYASSQGNINLLGNNFTQLQYFVDAKSLCNDTFCFSGQYVDVLEGLRYDIKENNLVPLKVNSDYILEYIITNSSSNNYPSSRLSVKNLNKDDNPTSMVNIKNYEIFGEFSSIGETPIGENNFNIPFNTPELLKENLSPFSEIGFNLGLFPLILGQSKLVTRLVSDNEVIYTLPINFSTTEIDTMVIDYEPRNIIPSVPFILTVIVKDSQGGLIEGANINVLQKINNEYLTISTGRKTNREGKANISLPALRNNETFVIEATKSKYYAEPVEFTVTKDIIDILHNSQKITSDSPLQAFIHKNDIDGELYTLTLENKTEYPLTLKEINDIDISFNKSYLLNLAQTKNYINNQIQSGFTIPANQTREMTVKFAPSESARTHPVSENIIGSLTGTVSLNNYDYLFNIPVNLKLSVGTGVFADDCLVVTGGLGEWTTVVSTTSQTTSLSIKNTCLSKEGRTPISIKNLQAKIVSEADRYGVYFLRVIGPGSGNQVQLSENYYRTVVSEIRPEEEYTLEITYNTNGIKFADIKTNIYFNAEVETEEGAVYVNKSPNDLLLKTNISVMNLTDCFSYYDSGRKINQGGLFVLENLSSKELTIKNECVGKATFEMNLCDGDDYGCRDLIIEGIEERNILRFSLNDSEKTVSIKRKDSKTAPGAYYLNNLISVKNNFGRTITSSFSILKINAKDETGLWMEDPFIEISENKVSEIKRLYNNNTEKNPWDYVKEIPTSQEDLSYRTVNAVSSENSTFVEYLSSNFNRNDESFKKMNFKALGDLSYITVIDEDVGWVPWVGGILTTSTLAIGVYSGAIGVSAATAAAAAAAGTAGTALGSTAIYTALAGIGPYGWAAIGVGALVSWAATSWKNEFEYPLIVNRFLDIEQKHTKPNHEKTKIIQINDVSESTSYINIFDITGSRYITYHDLITMTDPASKNKLTKNANLSLSNYTLCNQPGFIFDKFDAQIIKNQNCSGIFEPIIEDGKLSHTIECYGSKPTRNKIELETDFRYTCRADEVIWPEQAGIKPLQFNLSDDFYTQINNNSKKYFFKTIDFNPTLDDSIDMQDPAFKNTENIGKFRFAYFISKPEETPNYDLTLLDCVTDTGKIGKTGEGAVPNISLDWSWSLEDIDKCSENYCDATQLTQVVLNRINKAQELIASKPVSCPISSESLASQSLIGSYYIKDAQPYNADYNVSASRTGIDQVSILTSEEKLIVKISLDNRTGNNKNGNLAASLDNKLPKKAYVRDFSTDELTEITGNLSSIPIELKQTSGDTTTEVILEFYETTPILGENLSLSIIYSGEDSDPFNNSFSSLVSLDIYEQSQTSDCLVPATTVKENGISYLDMWFNKEMYPDNVVSQWTEQDILRLKELLEFEVYLITDKYNNNFINDFDAAYGGLASREDGSQIGSSSIMSSPTTFNNGYLSKLFKNNLLFIKQYSDETNNVNINVPGKYRIKIDFLFENSSWNFERNGEIDAEAFVTFGFISSPETDSVFYRLPFNGFVGQTTSGYNRQGYGVTYTGDTIRIDEENVVTTPDYGSNALRTVNITKTNDIYKINSSIESRGNVLSVKYQENIIDLIFSPSKAIPVLMEVETRNTNPLNVYYRLKDSSDNTLVDSTSLLRWTGVGSGCDFSGNNMFNMVYYDRYSGTEGPQSTFVLDWPQVIRTGKVYLRTIFYTPENSIYTLEDRSSQGVNVKFSTTGNNYSSNISLGSSSSQGNNLEINSIKKVFDMVSENKICVVNSVDGKTSEFFYNPTEIYSNNSSFIEPASDSLRCD